VDSADNVYVTDPQTGRVFEYGPTGQVSAVFGKIGNDASSMHTPTGIAVDPAGNVYVGDGDNGRVLKFAPVR
jgi:DNA-binding beta-propeller fold protein YncE